MAGEALLLLSSLPPDTIAKATFYPPAVNACGDTGGKACVASPELDARSARDWLSHRVYSYLIIMDHVLVEHFDADGGRHAVKFSLDVLRRQMAMLANEGNLSDCDIWVGTFQAH